MTDFVTMSRELQTASIGEEAKAALRSGNLMLAMALILGKVADSMSKLAIEKAVQLDDAATKAANNPKGQRTENQLNAELQSTLKLVDMFMKAMDNAIKTLGEANAKVASRN